MKRLLLWLSMALLTTAKPELYKEKEDFQFSRSSTDEGTKSGYYDAQRGNMGGNYERAHNMDGLAQHQMGGLVKQVEGELGDGSKTRTGSVFTAAKSQGIYGSGRYDLSNLNGRNFQEGTTYHDSNSYLSTGSRSHSSQYSAQNNARYNTESQSHGSGYGSTQQSDNLQEAQNSYGSRGYERGLQSQRSSQYYLQSGYQGSSDYERSNVNHQAANNFGEGTHNRLISQVPVRIVIRPGTRVAVPLATQTHSGSRANSYDQSSSNTDAEFLHSENQQVAYRPNGDAKQYESSYSYQKEWEKHDTNPAVVPLAAPVQPISKNSELYDESTFHHGSGYAKNADYNLASSQVRQQAGFNSQHSAYSNENRHQADYRTQQESASSNVNSNIYSHSGHNSDSNYNSANILGTVTSKPKSYHSSYSYHKSWERQGDPYVIIPPSNGASGGQTSQRLTELSGAQGEYLSHNYGSRKSHQTYTINDCAIECDPNSHIRVTRSYNSGNQFEQQSQDAGQTILNRSDNLEDLGQQTLDTYEQQNQDLGQQAQNKWDNLEDLGQQTQNNFEQQAQDAGQQEQNKLDNLEDLGQQTLNTFEQQTQDAGQQVQNKWDNLEDLSQQTQNTFKQQSQGAGQPVQNKWDNLEDLSQQTQNTFEQQTQDVGQQVQNHWGTVTDLGQQQQNVWEQSQGQLSDTKWDLGQQTQSLSGGEKNTEQEIFNGWNNLDAFGQQSENHIRQTQYNWDNQKQEEFTKPIEEVSLSQQSQTHWNPIEQQKHTKEQEHQISYAGTQEAEHKTQAFDSQDSFGWWPHQNSPQEKPQAFDSQNVFEQTINHDKSFQAENLGQQKTQDLWNTLFDKELTNTNRNTDGNVDGIKPGSTTLSYETPTKNTGSVNSLWGKLDNLDDDALNVNQFQSSFSQASQSSNWLNENFFSPETSNNFAGINQHSNEHQKNLSIWSLTNNKNKTDQFETHTIRDFPSQSTTDKDANVIGILSDHKNVSKELSPNKNKVVTSDFGRGDIEPEESLPDIITSTEKISTDNEILFKHEHESEELDDQQLTQVLQNDLIDMPTRKTIHIFDETEQASPKPFSFQKATQKSNTDDLHNKPSDRPYRHYVANADAPVEIEKQFETQHEFQSQNQQKFEYFEQNQFQQQNSDQEQQNTDLGNHEGRTSELWEQHTSHKQNNDDFGDQQFVDFSQVNQQWNSEQQNIQQQFPDDFYQQSQHPQQQNSHTTDLDQHNIELTLPNRENQNAKSDFEVFSANQQEERSLRKDNLGQQPYNNNVMLNNEVSTTPKPVTESPGFWKSIGNKFVSAKNKVASWFS